MGLRSTRLVSEICVLPTPPHPPENTGKPHIIKHLKQMLHSPRLFYICVIFVSPLEISENCTSTNACFFYFTQHVVTHMVMSLKTPLGTGIAWTTEVLFLAARWISGLWKILFQVLGFTAVFTHSAMLRWLYQRLCLFSVFSHKASWCQDSDINLESS